MYVEIAREIAVESRERMEKVKSGQPGPTGSKDSFVNKEGSAASGIVDLRGKSGEETVRALHQTLPGLFAKG